jgi:diguanylate cyclase (GGDEF)-like protein
VTSPPKPAMRLQTHAIALLQSLNGPAVHVVGPRRRSATVRLPTGSERPPTGPQQRRIGSGPRDREQALSELHDAHLDDLTGVHRRGAGTAALQQEIDRAQRSDGRLVMAFVDVDGLKSVNDSEGHAAGDALLRAVAAAIRSHLRSYDPIVRFGGDEFVCALSESDLDAARRRFEGISEMLAEARQSASISFGLAPLRPGDSLEDLVARADAALQLARTERWPTPFPGWFAAADLLPAQRSSAIDAAARAAPSVSTGR